MARMGMTVNVERCTGCYNCFLSCKDEFVGNDYLPISAAQPDAGPGWISLMEVEYGSGSKVKLDYVLNTCQQCENAPCIKPEFGGAVYRRADGIVIIDPVKAKGKKEIVASCPYGAIAWNDSLQLAQKCTMCAHMIDHGEKAPRCVESCPTQALAFGDIDDPTSVVSQVLKEKAGVTESYRPELGTRPALKYIGLPKPFVAGEVILADKPKECAIGARVTLTSNSGKNTLTTETNFLGDFEFKGLITGEAYTLRVEHGGYRAKEMNLRANAGINVGELALELK